MKKSSTRLVHGVLREVYLHRRLDIIYVPVSTGRFRGWSNPATTTTESDLLLFSFDTSLPRPARRVVRNSRQCLAVVTMTT